MRECPYEDFEIFGVLRTMSRSSRVRSGADVWPVLTALESVGVADQTAELKFALMPQRLDRADA